MGGSRSLNTLRFDIWGCRGSRSLTAGSSRLGVRTSCYSIVVGRELVVFDAGRGLTRLSAALLDDARFRDVTRARIFISHSHMDHWEGLKDADWFWTAGNGLNLDLHGTEEALETIQRCYDAPSFVPLNILSIGTVGSISYNSLKAGDQWKGPGYTVATYALNHFSGTEDSRRQLDTIGFKLKVRGGPTISYLCDHQPTADTIKMENQMARGAQLALIDAHFADIKDQAYGHGSQEHAADIARRHPRTLVLATHHGAGAADQQIRAGFRRHGRDLTNFQLAREGTSYAWNAEARTFEPR